MQLFSFFTASLQRRAWFLLTPLVLLFFLVLAYLLESSFKRSMVSGIEAQLAIQVKLLLADVESDPSQPFLVTTVQEPELNSPSGNLWAIAIDHHGQALWQSLSFEISGAQPDAVLEQGYQALLGETRFEELPSGGFRFIQTVAFDMDVVEFSEADETDRDSLSGPVHVVFVDSGKMLYQQIGVFRETLALSLLGALLVFVAIQFLLLRWLFRPLHDLGEELRQIESADKPMFENTYPEEIAPLTCQLNQFIDAERKQRERYRNTLSDLAHSLKTPLAAIKSSMATQRSSSGAADIEEQVDRMEQIVSHQLRRSSVGRTSSPYASGNASAVVARLLGALQKVYSSKAVVIDNQLAAELLVAVPEDELFEVLGNLLDNAFKYCSRHICLKSDSQRIYIENDGELIPQLECDQLLVRGVRLDESQPGQGLGLSVADSIVRAYGGELFLESVSGGGMRAVLVLPAG